MSNFLRLLNDIFNVNWILILVAQYKLLVMVMF